MKTRVPGFTLLELMVVMSIVAVLASVAIPEFATLQLRSKQGERAVLLVSIHNAVEDYYMREAHFPELDDPNNPGAGSTLFLGANPASAPSPMRRPWRYVSPGDDWQSLTLTVEGGVYYRYTGTGLEGGPQRSYWLTSEGDLDGDGVLDELSQLFTYQGAQLQRAPGTASPCCTQEIRIPGNDVTF